VAPPDATIDEKLRAIVQKVYGGDDVVFVGRAKGDLKRMARNGWDRLPVCVAKTQSSLSSDPKLRCRPTGFTVPVRRLLPATGAGFIVAIAGDMVRMPGLPRRPASDHVSVTDGVIKGL
jgi:formate--tetrahydrofolate ligase